MAADRGVLDLRDDLVVRDVVNFNPRIGCSSKIGRSSLRSQLDWLSPGTTNATIPAPPWPACGGARRHLPRQLPTPVHVDGPTLWFRNRDGSTVPLPSLSDGERAILLIFAEVASRAPEDGVVLIDEIEKT